MHLPAPSTSRLATRSCEAPVGESARPPTLAKMRRVVPLPIDDELIVRANGGAKSTSRPDRRVYRLPSRISASPRASLMSVQSPARESH